MAPLFLLYICTMVNIVNVYRSLKDLANKDQQGFVTPEQFNNLAEVAQMVVFNNIVDMNTQSRRLIRQGFDAGKDDGVYARKKEDLNSYIEEQTIDDLSGSSEYAKPSNMVKIISLSIVDEDDTQLEIIRDGRVFDMVKRSKLSAPTDDYPVAFVSNKIKVFPQGIGSLKCRFYRSPGSYDINGNFISSPPFLVVSNVNGLEIEVASASRNFDLPPQYFDDVVFEMASMIGVNLRDKDLATYNQAQQ